MRTVHIIVSGNVQGVGFRFYTYMMAHKFQIKGIVRNLENGDVEIFAQGGDEELICFGKTIHKGSPYSSVGRVREREIELEPFKAFKIG